MTRLKKFLRILICLLLLPLAITIILEHQKGFSIPLYFTKMMDHPWIGPYISYYLFVVGSLFLFMLLVVILVTIFYPNEKKQVIFLKSQGRLMITKKALEGYVSSGLAQEQWLKNPNVSCRLTKKKIIVQIKGDFNRETFDLKGRSEELSTRLTNELGDLLGLTEKKKFLIYLKNSQSDTKSKQRVI